MLEVTVPMDIGEKSVVVKSDDPTSPPELNCLSPTQLPFLPLGRLRRTVLPVPVLCVTWKEGSFNRIRQAMAVKALEGP